MALGDQADHLVADQDLVDQLDAAGPVDDQRDDGLGEDDVGAQGEQGERLGERRPPLGAVGQDQCVDRGASLVRLPLGRRTVAEGRTFRVGGGAFGFFLEGMGIRLLLRDFDRRLAL